MRAWKVKQFGEPSEVWTLDENTDSIEPGKNQVKVKVETAGLGLPDVLMCHDNYPLTPPLPFVPSQEAVGEIVAVGEGVNAGLIGKRVLGPTSFQTGHGGLAEYCLMRETAVFPVPDKMTGAEAAGFYIPYQTAWVGLVHRAKLCADDTVLVLGASGSSGCAAVQLAKAKGAKVIAVAGGPEKAAFCRELGADEIIDHRSEDITEATLTLTDGKGVSVVFDPVGGKPGRAGFKAMAFEGRFVVIGYASGEWARISLPETLMKNISLVGAMPVGFSAEFMRSAHSDLIAHWERGQLKVVGNQSFDFDDGLKAIGLIAGGKVEGKVVVNL